MFILHCRCYLNSPDVNKLVQVLMKPCSVSARSLLLTCPNTELRIGRSFTSESEDAALAEAAGAGEHEPGSGSRACPPVPDVRWCVRGDWKNRSEVEEEVEAVSSEPSEKDRVRLGTRAP